LNASVTEPAELHKTIWRIANDLRGSVNGWDFRTYVLVMLFTALSLKTSLFTSTATKAE
jgi:type I restriction-modification system DNA methylase subunit